MRQLIVRIDDNLHRRLKARAAEEGRSANSIVDELLRQALVGTDDRSSLRARLERSGLLVVPRLDGEALPRERVIDGTTGAGQSVSEALDAERGAR